MAGFELNTNRVSNVTARNPKDILMDIFFILMRFRSACRKASEVKKYGAFPVMEVTKNEVLFGEKQRNSVRMNYLVSPLVLEI